MKHKTISSIIFQFKQIIITNIIKIKLYKNIFISKRKLVFSNFFLMWNKIKCISTVLFLFPSGHHDLTTRTYLLFSVGETQSIVTNKYYELYQVQIYELNCYRNVRTR